MRLRDGESLRFLVSFCNVRGRAGGGPSLALVTVRGEELWLRWIPIKKKVRLAGATGLCFWNGMVCAVHQGGPETLAGFVILDPNRDFAPVSEGVLPSDPHSVCNRDGELYFAVTGRDRVYRAAYDSSLMEWRTEPYWLFPESSGLKDENHVNAIGFVDEELCVSGSGKKVPGRKWDSATRGFLYNVDRGEHVMKGVNHPHSLLADSGTVWTCESRENRLISREGDSYEMPSSYLRGLAADENYFYLGSSKRRDVSKSTGEVNADVKRRERGNCCVYRIARGANEPEVVVDFSHARDEIYDILLI